MADRTGPFSCIRYPNNSVEEACFLLSVLWRAAFYFASQKYPHVLLHSIALAV